MENVRRETTWQVFRPTTGSDGGGGQTVTMQQVGIERGDVRELIGRDIPVLGRQIGGNARQSGAEHTHSGYFRARANIRRNDELRRNGLVLEVISVTRQFPPGIPRLKVNAISIESGG